MLTLTLDVNVEIEINECLPNLDTSIATRVNTD